eukprot:COSAG05_NODE_29012_length_113_cov_3323.714286_1_plen_26_part_10
MLYLQEVQRHEHGPDAGGVAPLRHKK